MAKELKYTGTATVVRDMDFIAKKWDGPDALMQVLPVWFVYGSNEHLPRRFVWLYP